jgi:hypothetical protein
MKRWVCPICRRGINAPSRMSADDVRRFCLGCSKKTGKLVRRKAPALERQRAASRERSTRKQQSKRKAEARKRKAQKARDHERRFIMGHDVQALCKRWYALKAWGDRTREGPFGTFRMPSRPPELVVRLGDKKHLTAHAYPAGHRITMTVPKTWKTPAPEREADLLMTIVHELAHLFAPLSEYHGPAFQEKFCAAVHAIWGRAVSRDITSGPRGYFLTRLFTRKLTDALRAEQNDTVSAHEGSQSEGDDATT